MRKEVISLGGRVRKKWTLTLLCFVVGSALAFHSDASLGEYTAFVTMLLGAYHSADVIDKKLNGSQ